MTSTPAPTGADELPLFPASAPAVFSDPEAVRAMTVPTLLALADVVAAAGPDRWADPTPCPGFTVQQLLDHTLGWLQFFAAALNDPQRHTTRPDPEAYRVADDGRDPAGVVRTAADDVARALAAGALTGDVAVSQSRMPGPATAAMVLGEYLAHGWDLARALGLPWTPDPAACDAAREFFAGMITPEYRGGEHGFFDHEVAVPHDASAVERFVGFCGRDPGWTPPAA